LTNEHVVKECREVHVRPVSGTAIKVSIAALNKADDLALLQATGPSRVAATFRSDRGLRQGDEVVVYGYPLQSTLGIASPTMTTGIVSNLAGIGNDTGIMQISAPVQPGNSGGPLIARAGNVVGVVNATVNAVAILRATSTLPQNINFAIKSSVALNFLEANAVPVLTEPSSRDLRLSTIAESARKFTVLVECWS
jgi:S1-C subfamily serine protease